MNKCFITQWLLVLYLSLLVGCTKDVTSPEKVGEPISLGLTLDTYAGEDSNAKEHEKAIHNLYVFIYGSDGRLENPDNTRVQPATDGSLTDATGRIHGSWKVYGGQKDIYVIANVPDKLASTDKPRSSSIVAADALRRPTKDELAKFCMPWIGGSGNINVMRYNDFDYQTSGFFAGLMSGKKTVKVTAANQNQSVLVPLVRRYARIDLAVRKAPELANSDVKILSMDWSYIGLQSTLLAADPESTLEIYARTATPVVVGQISAADYTPLRPASKSNEAYEMYSGVYPKQDDPYRYQQLTLNALVNNSQVVYELNLCETGTDGKPDLAKPLPIEANKIYKINATLTRHTSDVDIEIQDWSDKQIDGSIGGSTLGLDSVVLVKAGRETLIPVQTVTDSVYVKLSVEAVDKGYALTGASPSTGVLGLKTSGGETRIPITGPVAYPVGEEYYMTVLAGNIRRRVQLLIEVTPVLEITDYLEFPYKGATSQYSVLSYGELGDPTGTKIPVPWTTEFSTDGGDTWSSVPPEWITQFTMHDKGSLSALDFTATVSAQKGYATGNPHNDVLRNTPSVSGIYDLSTQGGKTAMRTANCYVVNAPGTYSLPLVYGNAIDWVKGSRPNFYNESAYISKATGNYVLKNFVNHLDNQITDPYIYNNAGCEPKDAVLVWQDEENLVTNVALATDGHYLTFEVPKATIKQGNAIVAVQDVNGKIMWSWHIWVTDFIPGLSPTVEQLYRPKETQRDKVVTNHDDKAYIYMGVNLGWCDSEIIKFDPRKVLVRFIQPTTGQMQTLQLTQLSFSAPNAGNQPLFQFGRKDPMLTCIRNEAGTIEDKHSYGNYDFQCIDEGQVSIGKAIQMPYVFYMNASTDWCSNTYYNLWSGQNTATGINDDAVVKTIYDPSPVGYCLPASNAFSGGTYSGAEDLDTSNTADWLLFNTAYKSRFNNKYEEYFGWEMYCYKMPEKYIRDVSGGTYFLAASGYRDSATGNAGAVGRGGFYWSAVPSRTLNFASALYFSYVTFRPNANSPRSLAYAVRPVLEQ